MAPWRCTTRGRRLGSLDPVEVSSDRSEVHISRFVPSAQAGEQRRFGALLLLELTMFLVERFAGILIRASAQITCKGERGSYLPPPFRHSLHLWR